MTDESLKNATNLRTTVPKLMERFSYDKFWHDNREPVQKIAFRIIQQNGAYSLMLQTFRPQAGLRTCVHHVYSEEEIAPLLNNYLDAIVQGQYAPSLISAENRDQIYAENIGQLEKKFRALQKLNAEQEAILAGDNTRHESMTVGGVNKPLIQRQIHPVGEENANDHEWLFSKLHSVLTFHHENRNAPDAFLIDTYHSSNNGRKSVVTLIDSTHRTKTSFFLQFETEELQQKIMAGVDNMLATHNVQIWKPKEQHVGSVSPEEEYIAYASTLSNALDHRDISLRKSEPAPTPYKLVSNIRSGHHERLFQPRTPNGHVVS